jgi:nucleoid-associated protein YgaU
MGSYTVQSGDTLWDIAKKFYGNGTDWTKIYDANKSVIGDNPDLIKPGQVLTIN